MLQCICRHRKCLVFYEKDVYHQCTQLKRARLLRSFLICFTTVSPQKKKDHCRQTASTVSAHSPKRKLMLSPLCVRRILSAIIGLTSMVTSFLHKLWCLFCGILFVTWKFYLWINIKAPSYKWKTHTTNSVIGSSSIKLILASERSPSCCDRLVW